ncbi:primosomal replication protein N [Pseudidiomarina sp. 1APP75-32.1]|uniref:Replication restart protein PriB n=1 Tax=Pseudidiomarina terrestris TaxID=2820060 RepID=A0AAW7QXQ4_9GAMM|nr:primosomal replication protein N [Pseudidiomarina sp. 1APP75-32.1]MDN7127588.1 primosomal replication protein N [Pseudidiomarina sp. 1APR75-33.1]MDN7130334.1 primosomal replication protein N [Pseudidiomarina sp. 1APR75-15]MDN7136257.1 primosomal replication protein N [Pseudidiomarina sp. 1ASP75-5]MDN7138826.1 primosomal replication protein N [Pseudidiomarina sp. 1ASP75-14]MEA3588711.1 primosomal replication protein N [Pseudidiomarina sp. 1APP75-27a]
MVELSNQLNLGGSVSKPPKLTTSPAGIKHLRFVFDHQSEQQEAGLPRRSFVRILVVLSGSEAPQWANELTVGTQLQVTGFLNRIEDKNGVGKLVLHARQLVKI